MNRNLSAGLSMAAVAAAACAAAAVLVLPRTASAAGDIGAEETPFVSTQSRAEVRAQVLRGASDWGERGPQRVLVRSSVTRAAARDAYEAARAQVAATTGEDSGSAWFKRHPAPVPAAIMGGPGQ